jgi:hypothetical protein
MGVCVFVASGVDFDVDEYLRESPFKALSVFWKGHVPAKDNPAKEPRPDSGFVVLVNQDEKPTLLDQVMAALEFLAYYKNEFERLKEARVDNMLLDFGMPQQQVLQQAQYLPPELIQALSSLEMGLIFSVVQLLRG